MPSGFTTALTPVPEWKRSDWAVDVLPEGDPARDPGERESSAAEPTSITFEEASRRRSS